MSPICGYMVWHVLNSAVHGHLKGFSSSFRGFYTSISSNAKLGHVMSCHVWYRLLCGMNVNKRLGKVLDVAQPEPPMVEKFMNTLKQRKEEEDHEACDNALFPHNKFVSHLQKRPKGTLKARSTGVNTLLDAEQIFIISECLVCMFCALRQKGV